MKNIDILEKIISVFQWLGKSIKRNYRAILILRFLHFKIDKPLDEFKSIYSFSLADFSETNPNEIVIFFARKDIEKRFENAINDVCFEDIQKDIISSLDEIIITKNLSTDIDVSIVFSRFVDYLQKNFENGKSFYDKAISNEIVKIKQQLSNIKNGSKLPLQNQINSEFKSTNPLIIPSLPVNFIDRNVLENSITSTILNTAKDINNKSNKCHAIIGPGGVGKSTMLFSICRNKLISSFFPRILSITFSEITSGNQDDILIDIYHALSGKLNSSLSKLEYITNIKVLLLEQDTLIILDDVETPAEVDDLFSCRTDNCTIIITTRNKEIPLRLGITQPIEIHGFSEPEFQNLIHYYFKDKYSNVDIQTKIKPLAEIVEYNPLALSIICANISLGEYTWEEIYSDINDNIYSNPLEFPDPKNKSQSVDKSIEFSLKHLGEPERTFISFLSIFPRGYKFFLEDAAMLLSSIENKNKKTKNNEEIISNIRKKSKQYLQSLYKRGLLERTEIQGTELFQLHSLVIDNGIRYLKNNNALSIAILFHLNIYFGLLLTDDNNNAYLSNLRYFHPQIEVILIRIFNQIYKRSGLSIPDEFLDIILLPITEQFFAFLLKNGQFSRAEYWLRKITQLPSIGRFMETRKEAFRQLEFLYIKKGLPQLAREANKAFLSFQRKSDDSEEINNQLQSINILFLEEDYKKAFEIINLIDASLIKDETTLGRYYSTKSKILMGLKKWSEVLECIDRSIEIAEKEQDFQNLAKRLGDKCFYYGFKLIPDYDLSINYAIKSIRYGQICGDITILINRYLNLTHIFINQRKILLAKTSVLCAKQLSAIVADPNFRKTIEEQLYPINEIYSKYDFKDIIPEVFEFTFIYLTNEGGFDLKIFSSLVLAFHKNKDDSNLIEKILLLLNGSKDYEKLINDLPNPHNSNLALLILNIENIEFSGLLQNIFHQYGMYIVQNVQPNFHHATILLRKIAPKNKNQQILKNDLEYLCKIYSPINRVSFSEIRAGINNKLVIKFFELLFNKNIRINRKKHKSKKN